MPLYAVPEVIPGLLLEIPGLTLVINPWLGKLGLHVFVTVFANVTIIAFLHSNVPKLSLHH